MEKQKLVRASSSQSAKVCFTKNKKITRACSFASPFSLDIMLNCCVTSKINNVYFFVPQLNWTSISYCFRSHPCEPLPIQPLS